MKFKYLLILTMLVYVQACGQSSQKSVELAAPTSFEKAIQNKEVQLVDIRTPKEYHSGHLAKAINIDFYDKDFIQQMSRLNKNEAVYIYCHSGGRSGRAAKRLSDAGFSEIIDLKGGIVAWKKDEKPLVK